VLRHGDFQNSNDTIGAKATDADGGASNTGTATLRVNKRHYACDRSNEKGRQLMRLKGLPVQQSTKFTLPINMKTAKVLGIPFPPAIPAAADEVIE
jgi:hypothetical protein